MSTAVLRGHVVERDGIEVNFGGCLRSRAGVSILSLQSMHVFLCMCECWHAVLFMCCVSLATTLVTGPRREDLYAQDSIDLLIKSGIDFKRHEEQGIDVFDFGALIMMSGVVLNEKVKWMSFHSGYDFAYLLKLLTCLPLPDDEAEFFELTKCVPFFLVFFRFFVDVDFGFCCCCVCAFAFSSISCLVAGPRVAMVDGQGPKMSLFPLHVVVAS